MAFRFELRVIILVWFEVSKVNILIRYFRSLWLFYVLIWVLTPFIIALLQAALIIV